MNERDKQAALQAFRKEFPAVAYCSDLELSTYVTDAKVWLRACEWMHEYATQAAINICNAERVDAETTQEEGDKAYNLAIDHCVSSLGRALAHNEKEE